MVLLVLRVVLAAVFALAAVGKALDLRGSREAVVAFGIPARFASVVGAALPFGEAVLAGMLLVEPLVRAGALLAGLLLTVFIVAITRSLRSGQAPDCHCFGQIHSAPAGWSTLIRNGILLVLGLVVLVGGPGRSLAHLRGSTLAIVALGLLVMGLALAVLELLRENRRLRETQGNPADFAAQMNGLPSGVPTPDLELHTLDGVMSTLKAQLTAGRPSVLVHVHPGCGPCQAMIPDLADWTSRLAGTVDLVTISSGDPGINAALVADFPEYRLMISDAGAFRLAFRVDATPSAVPVTADGRIAGRSVAGSVAIESLIRATVRGAEPAHARALAQTP